jgi:hypothetical protein
MGTRPLQPNQETILELPYSEVCMHLGVAGTRMRARLEPNGMVQLLDADGRAFSFPITAAEAGLDHDQDGLSSRVADPPAPPADPPDPRADPVDLRAGQLPTDPSAAGPEHPAILEAISEPLAVVDRHTWRGEVIDGPAGPLYWHPTLGYLSVPNPEPDEQP